MPAKSGGEERAFWGAFSAGLRGSVPPAAYPYLTNPAAVSGVWKDGVLTLWVQDEFTKAMLNKSAVTEPVARAAQARFGVPARVAFSLGTPPAPAGDSSPAPDASPLTREEEDALEALLDFGKQFDNITIQE